MRVWLDTDAAFGKDGRGRAVRFLLGPLWPGERRCTPRGPAPTIGVQGVEERTLMVGCWLVGGAPRLPASRPECPGLLLGYVDFAGPGACGGGSVGTHSLAHPARPPSPGCPGWRGRPAGDPARAAPRAGHLSPPSPTPLQVLSRWDPLPPQPRLGQSPPPCHDRLGGQIILWTVIFFSFSVSFYPPT